MKTRGKWLLAAGLVLLAGAAHAQLLFVANYEAGTVAEYGYRSLVIRPLPPLSLPR